MNLRSVPIEAVTKDHLRSLVEEGVAELRSIEYKRELPGEDYEDKKEFLADVSSFANSGGGDIVFGIIETGGVPQALAGFETADVDAEMSRLEESLRSNVEPRIEGLRMQPIALGGGRHALILRVPRSPGRPHVVHYKKHWRFYGRGETGKFPMNYAQVRQAFLSSGNTEDRITRFRDERLRKIRSGETPVPIEGKARAVLQLVPFSAFDSPAQEITLDTRRPPLNQGLLQALSWGGSLYHNFDGVLADAQTAGGKIGGYAQLFRSGVLEAVDNIVFNEGTDGSAIASVYFEKSLIEGTQRYLELLHGLGVQPPALLMLSLTGVKGYEMLVGSMLASYGLRPIDRDDLILPAARIDDLRPDRAGVELLLRPLLDAVWNACGRAGSPNFDEEGCYRERR